MKQYKVKSALDIPGWTNLDQHKLYIDIAKQLPKNPKVLELGCGWGKSTWGWLDALPTDTEYYVLDIFFLNKLDKHFKKLKEQHLSWGNKKIAKYLNNCLENNKNQKEIFLECVSQHPKFNCIKEVYDQDYFEWKKQNTIEFDMVYIDGDHSYEHVNDQLEYFKNVPIVCGDDYKEARRDYFEGLMKAVDNYIKNNNKKHELFPAQHQGLFVIYND